MKIIITVAIITVLIFTGAYLVPRRIAPPAVLMVDDFPWTVKMVDTFPGEEVEIWGKTYFHTHLIYIVKNTCIEKEKEVVIHEALHAATGEAYQLESVNGHLAIKNLTIELTHILQDNPELRRYLAQ